MGNRKSAGIVGMAVVGSRMLGLVRELVFAAMFGAGKWYDAFLGAFQIPNLMRDLFAEGALSTAFTTTFTKTHAKEGDQPAWALANLLFSTMILVIGAICVAGIAASPMIVEITNFGFHSVPGKFELTVELTRIMFPFILFVSLAAVVMGVLNARFVFGLPASASTAFNFVSIVFGVGLALLFEPQADWRHPVFGQKALYGVTIGVLLGGVTQLAIQMPSLWRLGFRFHWRINFKDEKLRQVWRLMWPSVIAGAAVQVNVMVNGMFASEIDGARSWLNYAFRLMQFPIGVFGVAIATVTLPAVARHHARADLAAFGHTVEESLRLAFFLTIPAAVGLAVLAPRIIGVIYQRGNFTAQDTALTAAALQAYVIGLAGYAAIKILVPCFYALDKPRIPLQVSLFGIAVNVGCNFMLVKWFGMGHVGLAFSTAILATVNFLQLVVYLRKHIVFGSASRWAGYLGRVLCAAGLMGVASWYAADAAAGSAPGFSGRLASLVAGLAAGVAVYGVATVIFRIPETTAAMNMVRRKFKYGQG